MRAGTGFTATGKMAGPDHWQETVETDSSVLWEPEAEVCQRHPSLNSLGRQKLAIAWASYTGTLHACCLTWPSLQTGRAGKRTQSLKANHRQVGAHAWKVPWDVKLWLTVRGFSETGSQVPIWKSLSAEETLWQCLWITNTGDPSHLQGLLQKPIRGEEMTCYQPGRSTNWGHDLFVLS